MSSTVKTLIFTTIRKLAFLQRYKVTFVRVINAQWFTLPFYITPCMYYTLWHKHNSNKKKRYFVLLNNNMMYTKILNLSFISNIEWNFYYNNYNRLVAQLKISMTTYIHDKNRLNYTHLCHIRCNVLQPYKHTKISANCFRVFFLDLPYMKSQTYLIDKQQITQRKHITDSRSCK